MNSTSLAAQPATFTFQSHYPIRTVLIDGEPWFIASDLLQVLDLDMTAVRRLDADEKGLHSTQTLGGAQKVAVVNESGLYTLVMRCRDATKPGSLAHRFRKWVTAEVLPTLRRTGTYTLPVVSTRQPKGAEVLDANDLANVRRVIWRITANQADESGWVRICWASLRKTAGIAHGDRFCVDHLPIMAEELKRLCLAADTVRAAADRVSNRGLSVVGSGGCLDDVIREVRKTVALTKAAADPLKLERWTQQEFDRLVKRLPAVMDHPEAGELQLA